MTQTTIVLQISKDQVPEIKKVLAEKELHFSALPYAYFTAKGEGVACTLYLSGKMVIQGRLAQTFVHQHFRHLSPPLLENASNQKHSLSFSKEPHIGSDESGKGDFFGPLCISAVYASENDLNLLQNMQIIRDSKALSKKDICTAAQFIQEHFLVETLVLSPPEYNRLYEKFQNLNHLLAYGHACVIQRLFQKTDCRNVLVDQFSQENLVEKFLKKQGAKQIQVTQRVRAETDLVVAAASILARDAFVQNMQKLSDQFGIHLPKGGGASTISTGKEIVKRWGSEVLQQMSKTHFKNMENIIL